MASIKPLKKRDPWAEVDPTTAKFLVLQPHLHDWKPPFLRTFPFLEAPPLFQNQPFKASPFPETPSHQLSQPRRKKDKRGEISNIEAANSAPFYYHRLKTWCWRGFWRAREHFFLFYNKNLHVMCHKPANTHPCHHGIVVQNKGKMVSCCPSKQACFLPLKHETSMYQSTLLKQQQKYVIPIKTRAFRPKAAISEQLWTLEDTSRSFEPSKPRAFKKNK